jgi:uncharacterized protein YacL
LTANLKRAIIPSLFIIQFILKELFHMSADLIARIIGMVGFSILGAWGGDVLSAYAPGQKLLLMVILAVVGALFGLVVTPYLTTRPMRGMRTLLARMPAETLISGLIGLVAGLLAAALLAFPLSLLPSPFGKIMPFLGVLLFGYFGVAIFIMRRSDIVNILGGLSGRRENSSASSPGQTNRTILLDTSVIIDGRVADIAKTGFLSGTLLIPRFVLNELQYIADSPDGLRRARGRRGMEVLSELQKATAVAVRISDIDVDGVREVDDKLVILARQMKCPILTNDYNLNRVAELQGVAILNINELANAIKSVVLPGELMEVDVIQEGKEINQGVGYMEDGTMVVVENGNKFLNQQVHVTVTKVLQTAAGRMIFARPEGKE